MDYELAKQLREAGFQNTKYKTIIECMRISLSELIEACGDGFEWLGLYKAEPYGYKDDEFFNKDKWVCGKWEDSGCSEGSYFIEETFGSTPEEAVAKLWLELNKK